MKNLQQIICVALLIAMLPLGVFSQVAISDNASPNPDASAVLDLQSNGLGFLLPRMTEAERGNIIAPAKGLIVFQTDGNDGLYFNTGDDVTPVWHKVIDWNSEPGLWSLSAGEIYYTGGNVGIGTTDPGNALHVQGDARITGALQFDNNASAGHVLTTDASGNATWQAPVGNDGDWTIDGTNVYSAVSGNVGIGSISPSAKLDVVGAARITAGLQLLEGSATDGYVLTTDASGNASWAVAPGGDDGDWVVSGGTMYSNAAITGNVGIGTTVPAAKLDVDGSARITGAVTLENGATDGFVLTTDASGLATWQDVNTNIINDSDWELHTNGTDMYSLVSGNIGIGSVNPRTKLDVDGAAMFTDSVYVTGRPGRIRIEGEQNYSAALHYEYRDTTKYSLYHRIKGPGYGTDYFMFSSFESENNLTANGGTPELIGFNPDGRILQQYQGASAAFMMFSDAAFPMLYIDVNNSGEDANGIQSRVLDVASDVGSLCIGGWNEGHGSAVYGQNKLSDNYGYLGTENHGAYGQNNGTANRGALGTATSGAYGIYDDGGDIMQGTLGLSDRGAQGTNGSTDFWGALGMDNSGVYGRLSTNGSSQSIDPNDFAVKGLGVEVGSDGNRGSGYANQVGGVMGYNTEGTLYSAGVYGSTDDSDDDERTSGVFGSIENADEWGALGYEHSGGSNYGGYFSNATGTGTGKAASGPASSIGIGVYGDLFGAHIHGNVYGVYAQGENYGLYADGDMYRTGADVHLQTNASGQNSVMYTLVTTEMTIQTYGIGTIQDGKSSIVFDEAFADVVSSNEPIIVTITPIGQTKGVYLDRVDGDGFAVAENNNGKSNVQFSWIAIGKRKGFENISLPADVIAADYNTKIQQGLQNDANMDTDGEGLYYENGTLVKGQTQQSRSGNNSGIVSTEVAIERGALTERNLKEQAIQDQEAKEDIPGRKK